MVFQEPILKTIYLLTLLTCALAVLAEKQQSSGTPKSDLAFTKLADRYFEEYYFKFKSHFGDGCGVSSV
jgi:hypothetical protein